MLDDAYAAEHAEVAAGPVRACWRSPTPGTGMTPECMAQAFEPFFTTKPEGQGTGLGPSMVYGFVKQSGGHVKIYSEPGHGHHGQDLPAALAPRTEDAAAERPRAPGSGGTETVLVVEDDAQVRATAVELLTELGYRVLKAADGAERAGDPRERRRRSTCCSPTWSCRGRCAARELARRAKEVPPSRALHLRLYGERDRPRRPARRASSC